MDLNFTALYKKHRLSDFLDNVFLDQTTSMTEPSKLMTKNTHII
jgi:hypothetical protein|tara:strand:+ start:1031 stop:1162 length:132 start_codon:yes stop_codon:yes gene_type:complete